MSIAIGVDLGGTKIEVVALDEAGERSLFGDALPPGLKLIA